jgi:predicted house-cleaning noncanonical NTP pyrophosphatase (MazG superfamily)
MYVGAQRMTHGNGIVIQRDEGSHTSSDSGQQCDAQELADQQYAMQLQAKIDREMNNGYGVLK